jgi:hypothetical protein
MQKVGGTITRTLDGVFLTAGLDYIFLLLSSSVVISPVKAFSERFDNREWLAIRSVRRRYSYIATVLSPPFKPIY